MKRIFKFKNPFLLLNCVALFMEFSYIVLFFIYSYPAYFNLKNGIDIIIIILWFALLFSKLTIVSLLILNVSSLGKTKTITPRLFVFGIFLALLSWIFFLILGHSKGRAELIDYSITEIIPYALLYAESVKT